MTEKSVSAFVGNTERALSVGKFDVVQKCTANKPIELGTVDGVHLFKTEFVVGLDTKFPTKKGGVTSALIIVPIDGAKTLAGDWGSVKFDAGPMFIYKAARMFNVLDANGDVAKKGRKSAASEIEELKKQLAEMATLLRGLQK